MQHTDWAGVAYEHANRFRHSANVHDEETCTRAGAERLKQLIEDYWARKGHIVTATIVEQSFHPAIRTGRFDIRSDMVNALPRGWKE